MFPAWSLSMLHLTSRSVCQFGLIFSNCRHCYISLYIVCIEKKVIQFITFLFVSLFFSSLDYLSMCFAACFVCQESQGQVHSTQVFHETEPICFVTELYTVLSVPAPGQTKTSVQSKTAQKSLLQSVAGQSR